MEGSTFHLTKGYSLGIIQKKIRLTCEFPSSSSSEGYPIAPFGVRKAIITLEIKEKLAVSGRKGSRVENLKSGQDI